MCVTHTRCVSNTSYALDYMRNLAWYLLEYQRHRLDYTCNLMMARYLLEYQHPEFRKSKYDVGSSQLAFSFRSWRLLGLEGVALASFHLGRVG